MVKNPSSNTTDVGRNPGQGTEILQCRGGTAATEPMSMGCVLHNKKSHHNEKPVHHQDPAQSKKKRKLFLSQLQLSPKDVFQTS